MPKIQSTFYEANPMPESAIHVLLVGVGHYHHLAGGEDPKPGLPGLAQLKSPPLSAIALAHWFRKNLRPNERLGSIELVLSPAQEVDLGDGPRTAPDATTANIEAAFVAWFNRCNDSEKNFAVAYFCGHGVQVGTSQILATSDFGSNPLNPLNRAINLSHTYYGMGVCQARTQLFLFDTCRTWPANQPINDPGIALCPVTVDAITRGASRVAPSISATAAGAAAMSASSGNGQTRMAELLLQGLNNGLAAERVNGRWIVHTGRLGPALREIVEANRRANPGVDPQVIVPGGENPGMVPLHELAFIPDVDLYVNCQPVVRTPFAELSLQDWDRTVNRNSPRPNGELFWRERVPAGGYKFDAVDGATEGHLANEVVVPPVTNVSIELL